MNERIKELAKQAGYQEDLFGVGHWDMPECKNFVKLIAEECAKLCMSQADRKNIRRAFDLPVESDVKYEAPPVHGSITRQYTRQYNIPRNTE